MALIECPECGREVSSSAAACPECAYPVGAGTPAVPPRAMSGSTKRPWWRTAISISNRLTGRKEPRCNPPGPVKRLTVTYVS